MNEDKSLVKTARSVIYQGEKNADTIRFLIPKHYEDKDVANCKVVLKYRLPYEDEDINLQMSQNNNLLYDEYYCYETKIDADMTKSIGRIKIRIGIIGEDNSYILKSANTYIDIHSVEYNININSNGNNSDDDTADDVESGYHFIVQEDFE